MKTMFLAIMLSFTLFILCGADSVDALEFQPLVAKNADGMDVFSGTVGDSIIFYHAIYNDESDTASFDVSFTAYTIDGKQLDEQIMPVNLKSNETVTLTYKFIPFSEGNYYVHASSGNHFSGQTITFSALDDGKNYQKKTIRIYSDLSDEDCNLVCTDPSEMVIDAGTVVEWDNITSGSRSLATGNYVDDKNGISWSADQRFHNTVGPNKKSSFLFLQPGEYQLFLAEHRSTDVVGTIHVMSDQFREANKTFNILNKIMNDEDYGIPISSLHINPKNSVITVGINDKQNPLFSLDIYKTMIYKQVGNVYLNIVSDHDSFRTELCDVNDEVAVRAILEKDSVVKQFLQRYPSATFEHFKTGDEPGNPRTYSEFHHGIFLLRVFVSTYDPHGVCYHVYGYSIEYDVPNSLIRADLPKSIFSESNDVHKAVQAVKTLTSPLQQYNMGIKYQGNSVQRQS